MGTSHIYMINNTNTKLYFTTHENAVDSSIELYTGVGETSYVCSDAEIGGWLQPSKILSSTEIFVLDQYGNELGIISKNCENDSSWVHSANSTWKESFWYYTIK